jgi:hypothetical protein
LKFNTTILGAACVAAMALVSAPAFADVSGLVSGDYSNLDLNHGGSASIYGVDGSGMFGLAPNWAAQIDGGYDHANVSGGGNGNDWVVNGSTFWRLQTGRLGATVGYNATTGGGADEHATHYGLFGDWYAGRAFTVGVKGGLFNGSHDNSGEYAGVALTGYVVPNLSLSAGYDYAHFKHFTNENDYSAEAEWLISRSMPVSIYGGYTRSEFSGTGGLTANTWSVGVRVYFDGRGESLVQRQQTGAEIYGTNFGPAALHL